MPSTLLSRVTALRPARRRDHRWTGLETLEGRVLLTASFPTAVEQYMVELINRARLNPTAEAARYGIDLNEGLAPGTLSSDPRQPVAVNLFLTEAAQLHAKWMADNGLIRSLPHFENLEGTASGGTPRPGYFGAGDRANTAGFSGGLPGFENQAWSSGGGTTPTAAKTDSMHQLLFKDFTATFEVVGRGHRKNILNASLTQVGVGTLAKGDAVSVQDFASGGGTFLTGVIYNDSVKKDNFYTPGEGIGGVTVTATRISDNAIFEATTWDAGGYTLPLGNGTYNIVAVGGSLAEPMSFENVVIAGLNVKRDFVLAGGSGGAPAGPAELSGTLSIAGTLGAVVPGDKLAVTLTVTNTGGTASGPFAVNLHRSADNTLNIGPDPVLATLNVAKPIAPGKSAKLTFNLTFTGDTPLGESFFIANIDPANAVPETNENNNTAALAAPPLVWSAGTFAGRKAVKLTLPDSNGVPTTFLLKGNGRADVTLTENGFDISVTGGDLTTSLAITSATQNVIHSVTTNGSPIKDITAPRSLLTGDLNLGAVTKVQFDDVTGGNITIGQAPAGAANIPAVAFLFDQVNDLSITSAIPIASYTVNNHRDLDDVRDVIAAPWMNALTSRGVFEADVLLSDATAKATLGKFTVAGTVSGAVIDAAGHIGTVSIGGAANAAFYAGRAAGAPRMPELLEQLGAFSIKSFVMKPVAGGVSAFIDSVIAAKTLGKVTLVNVVTDNAGEPHGIVADTLAAFTATPATPALPPLKNADAPIADATGDTGDDFVVRLL